MSESEKAAESLERDDKGRFVEPEASLEPQGESKAAPAPEPEPEAPAPTPSTIAKPSKKKTASVGASSSLDGEVVLAALVFEAPMRNSASVRLVQDRLAELGHGAARRDKAGWLSDGTMEALECFQDEAGLDATGYPDAETVEALMKGTKVKVV